MKDYNGIYKMRAKRLTSWHAFYISYVIGGISDWRSAC